MDKVARNSRLSAGTALYVIGPARLFNFPLKSGKPNPLSGEKARLAEGHALGALDLAVTLLVPALPFILHLQLLIP